MWSGDIFMQPGHILFSGFGHWNWMCLTKASSPLCLIISFLFVFRGPHLLWMERVSEDFFRMGIFFFRRRSPGSRVQGPGSTGHLQYSLPIEFKAQKLSWSWFVSRSMSQFYKSKAIADLVNYTCKRIRPRNSVIFFKRVNQYSTCNISDMRCSV